jgi:hypothetical protein
MDPEVRSKRFGDPGWSMKTIPDIGLWTALIPVARGQKVLSLDTMALSVQELSFPKLPGYEGEEVRLQRGSLSFIVLAYQAGSFNESRFVEFLEALQHVEPVLSSFPDLGR